MLFASTCLCNIICVECSVPVLSLARRGSRRTREASAICLNQGYSTFFPTGQHTYCNGLPPGEAISSSTRPKSVGAKARPIIMRLNSDPYRNSTAFSNSAVFPSLSITKLPLHKY
ncbi:hypothetical protein TNCV_690171 [Trichonephila clavipes]|nr:hypothetical protein TNCV_690171 [Trichonephila clavipes]